MLGGGGQRWCWVAVVRVSGGWGGEGERWLAGGEVRVGTGDWVRIRRGWEERALGVGWGLREDGVRVVWGWGKVWVGVEGG